MIHRPTIFMTTRDLPPRLRRQLPLFVLGLVTPPFQADILVPRPKGGAVRVLQADETGNGKQGRNGCR